MNCVQQNAYDNNNRVNIGLNIHILSFNVKNSQLKENDEVRVSFTTFPEKVKEHFCIKAKKMNYVNHVFALNITKETKAILLVFRRKNFLLNDPIIGCLTLQMNEIPEIPQDFKEMATYSSSSEIKKKKIFEPIVGNKDENSNKVSPKAIGEIELQFTITEPYVIKEHKHQKENKNNSKNDKNNNKINNKLNKKSKANTSYIIIE